MSELVTYEITSKKVPKIKKIGYMKSAINAEVTIINWHGDTYVIDGHAAEANVYDYYSGAFIRTIPYLSNFGSAFVYNEEIYFINTGSANIYIFKSSDLITATLISTVTPYPSELYYNTSVTKGADGKFYMAYELGIPQGFSFKFLMSNDLITWTNVGVQFSTEYSGCPYLSYQGGYYYVVYLVSDSGKMVSKVSRTQDFFSWEAGKNVFLEPLPSEGTNNSDVSILQLDERCIINYFSGNQISWGKLCIATYEGSEQELLESFF